MSNNLKSRANNVPKVCVIILNYQTYELTISYAKKLLNQKSISIDIIIIDNASPNSSYGYLETEFKSSERIRVILSPKNGGYSYGNNIGLNLAFRGIYDYIFISNNDVTWEHENDLSLLLNEYEELNDSNVAFFSAKMTDSNGSSFPAWKIPSIYFDLGMFIPLLSNYFVKKFKIKLGHKKTNMVEVIPGSFFGAKFNTFKHIGYLDENVFLYCEERLLAKKVRNQGYHNLIINSVRYIHDSSHTIDSVLSKKSKMKESFKSLNYYHSIHNRGKVVSRTILKLFQKIYICLL